MLTITRVDRVEMSQEVGKALDDWLFAEGVFYHDLGPLYRALAIHIGEGTVRVERSCNGYKCPDVEYVVKTPPPDIVMSWLMEKYKV